MTAKPDKPQPIEPQDESQDEPTREPEAAQPEIQALQVERDDLLARLQRISADYVNYQKRAQRDLTQARDYANEGLMKSLLSVIDDMERALDAARANHADDDPLLVGMKLVHDKLLATLANFGLSRIELSPGQPFNPEFHQAMMQQPTDEHPPATVLGVLQNGYQLKGRVMRPAAVIVSTAAEQSADDEADE
jgi:molecular chaperone GrpE